MSGEDMMRMFGITVPSALPTQHTASSAVAETDAVDGRTVGELVEAGLIHPHAVTAAVNLYAGTPTTGTVSLDNGYGVDITAAVAAHPFASKLLATARPGKAARRAAIRSAILLARPVKT